MTNAMNTLAVEDEVHRIADELHVDLVPGTEILADAGHHHVVKSGSASDIVLVPQPTDSPHDPLNWNAFWKTASIFCATLNSFAQGLGPLALAPVFPDIMEAFDCDLPAAIRLTGVTILVLGFSNFLWVPISTTFGRRTVYITSAVLSLGSSVWRAKATSYNSFMGACALNGISAGPGETIQPAVLADVFFLHDRGKQNTVYFAFYFAALMVGPIIAGSMALHVGWRSFWWLNTALLAATIVLTLVLFPETKWDRANAHQGAGSSPLGSAAEKSKAEADYVATDESSSGAQDVAAETLDPHLGRGRPSKGQFALWQTNKHWGRHLLKSFWLPWKLLAFPIVEFASFVVSWTASFFLLTNITQSEAFAVPPYSFTSEKIGLFNLATLVGAAIGLVTAGPLSDYISMRSTRRNRGVREPEMRLPAIIPYLIILIIGNFVVAFGYQNHWHWAVIVVVGYGCAGIQVTALPAIASAYAIDSYKPAASSLFVSITVNKNLWGYGLSKFLAPWIAESGYVKPIMCNMCLTVLWCTFGILFYYKGKTFRRWTRNSNVHKEVDY